jgi:hypothetical protein
MSEKDYFASLRSPKEPFEFANLGTADVKTVEMMTAVTSCPYFHDSVITTRKIQLNAQLT